MQRQRLCLDYSLLKSCYHRNRISTPVLVLISRGFDQYASQTPDFEQFVAEEAERIPPVKILTPARATNRRTKIPTVKFSLPGETLREPGQRTTAKESRP